MTEDSLIEAPPELVAFVRRDGTVLQDLGSRHLGLTTDGELVGRKLTDLWPEEVPARLLQLIRRALRDRGTAEGQFSSGARRHEARMVAQGRDRVLCVIREASAAGAPGEPESVRGGDRGALERRVLFERLTQSIAGARLRERQLAVCMIYLQGTEELGRVLDFGIVDQMAATHVRVVSGALEGAPTGYVDRLAENILLVVVERFEDREAIRDLANRLLKLLSEPVAVGEVTFTAAPSAGVALLGDDGSDARQLLESARSAMLEARRCGAKSLQFYSDTLELRSLARLDLERELRDAIAQDRLALRYATRHCLETGQRVAIHAYLRWPHPIGGDIAAAEFLPIAESTGLAMTLSRWALTRFQRDMAAFRALDAPGIKFSFGALRSHLSSGELRSDVEALLAGGVIAAKDFELRIAERTLAGLADPGATLRPLADLGVTLVLDEFGRGFSSLPRLARLPVRALQLDRSLALSSATDLAARRAAAAAFAIANALDLIPMSAGIDDVSRQHHLRSLGCAEGLGDVFGGLWNSNQMLAMLAGHRQGGVGSLPPHS